MWHQKEAPKGVVSCLENNEGVTSRGGSSPSASANKLSDVLEALVRFHKDIPNQYARVITLSLLYGDCSVMVEHDSLWLN